MVKENDDQRLKATVDGGNINYNLIGENLLTKAAPGEEIVISDIMMAEESDDMNHNAPLEDGSVNYNFILGNMLSKAAPEEKIVISGISGAFPDSNNVHQFRDNLFNKVNMLSKNRRWDIKHPEIPIASGTIPEINRYDAGFFGVHERQSHSLDPLNRMIQEKTIEAIFDAGLHPSDFENTRTGVFIGLCYSESEKKWFLENTEPQWYGWTGTEKSMVAHRLSYFLKLKGPSFTLDSACSSTLYGLEHAFRAIRLGEIDSAIVGGANLCLNPMLTLQFARLGVLSKDGTCKVFDELGNGYARSEAVGVVILQKAKDAKRMYSEIVYAKINCDGYKYEGINFPSANAQRDLLLEFYQDCDIDRYSLSFLEAHGTGTFVGDPEECSAVDQVLTTNRETPLLIGSVKSNMGHSEPPAGVCSLIKCIIGMETGFIPPNLNYSKPKESIKGLVEGRMKVVVEKIPFEDKRGLVGVNSFGFGGGNSHVLLRWNPKEKVNYGLPNDNLPRLVCVSGRTEEAVTSLFDEISENELDTEHIILLQEGFRKSVKNHLYRGYTIVTKSGEIMRSTKYSPGDQKPLYFEFGELTNWYEVGKELMVLPVFANTFQRVQKCLANKGFIDILFHNLPDQANCSTLRNVAIQIGIMDILNLLEIQPTGWLGNSFGVLFSAYYDGILTLEEIIDCTIAIHESVVNTVNPYLGNYGNYREKCNRTNNFFLKENNDENNHNKNGSNFSSTSIIIRKYLQQNLSSALNKDKQWNGKPTNNKDRSTNDYISSLINGLFQECQCENSIILQIGNGLIHSNVVDVISIYNSRTNNDLIEFLKGIGSLYKYGYNPQIKKLYPPVDLPVSRGTRMISPYIKWKHDRELFVIDYNSELKTFGAGIISIPHTDYTGHVIDGRHLLPATGYLYLVWQTFSKIQDITMNEMKIVIENCKFLRATSIPKRGELTLYITIHKHSGNFEMVEGESVVVTGRIYLLEEDVDEATNYYQPIDLTKGVDLPLKTKDIYKEFKLRGYNYKGQFRAIEECDRSGSKGFIKWEDNWVTFLDNMLQMKILPLDTRLLYVPTYMAKLTIDVKNHLHWINKEYVNKEIPTILPVFNNQVTGVISCGGIRISGIIASSINRKKYLRTPILEKYTFIPNTASLPLLVSIRTNLQIILENTMGYKVKIVELIDEFSKKDGTPIIPIIQSVLQCVPLIQPSLKILSKTPLELNFDVENKTLENETDCSLVIASNITMRSETLKEAFASLADNGFIMSRESPTFDPSRSNNLNGIILTMYRTSTETLLLIRKTNQITHSTCVKINSSDDFSWVPSLQGASKANSNENIIIYSENDPNNGIIGFYNCLRREPGGANIRCVSIVDNVKKFDTKDYFYSNQIKNNMAVNVYKNGQWGTYRHVLMNDSNVTESEHCYVNVTVRGDLSSLRWIEGPLQHNTIAPPENLLVKVHYAALNFRDIMTASGRINADVSTQQRLEQECVLGFEYSGIDERGKRVMGMLSHGALSTLVIADSYITFDVPDSWSLEEAATVPVVYSTVIYALCIRGRIKKGETILIHSGTGGIGQAAIRLALHYGCKVFTTVGTQEKRDFLKDNYPLLQDHHIGNSRDESFEEMIYRETNGRGVDIVLNSLAEDKLLASVRCLARGGRFLEIGKFDMAINSKLSLLLFHKEASFHGVMLDALMTEGPGTKANIGRILAETIKCGGIKPLNRTIFKYNEIEQAFRFMMTGKHIGKVLIQVRESEIISTSPSPIQKFPGISRYFCNPEKSYIVIGGLGGVGLELADWLVLRGARKLVLTSRNGISTGNQNYRIRIWQSYGALVNISTADITKKEGCKKLIKEALELGSVDAIFNLAAILADAIFENQTPENFLISFGAKAAATEYLDELTRIMCPDLNDFVVFSSVSCGRGNAGQTNYGMANSVMEKICETRKEDGYPALAIQWGPIGEVGLVAEMQEGHAEIEICGVVQQRISSCLQVLDSLLRQNDAAVVSSMVIAEKRGSTDIADNMVDAVAKIIGITDIKSVSPHTSLAELGMDSMTAVEIKQVLEREFEVFLTANDMRTMTLQRLKDIQEKRSNGNVNTGNKKVIGMEAVLRLIGDESYSHITSMTLKSNVDEKLKAPKLLLFPGVEGFASSYEILASRLNAHTVCMQFRYDIENQTIADIVQSIMPSVDEHLRKDEPFNIVAYSYGTAVALEIVDILESRGYTGTIICLDGSPVFMKEILKNFNIESEQLFETALICQFVSLYLPLNEISKHKEFIFKCKCWDDRVNYAIKVTQHRFIYGENYHRAVANGIYRRLKAVMDYRPSYRKLKSNAKVYKPTDTIMPSFAEDYHLSEIFEKQVEIQTFEGNHITLLDNALLADSINACIN